MVFTVMQVHIETADRKTVFILSQLIFSTTKVTLAFIALVTLVVALCLPKKNEKILQRNSDEQNNSKNKPNDNNVTQITSRMKSWGPDLYTTKVSSEV